MNSPEYLGKGSESRPGTMRPFSAEQRPKMPSMARRPLLISARSPCSLRSGVAFVDRLKGSKKLKGTGWGKLPLRGGK